MYVQALEQAASLEHAVTALDRSLQKLSKSSGVKIATGVQAAASKLKVTNRYHYQFIE